MPHFQDEISNTIAWTYTQSPPVVAVGDTIFVDGERCVVTNLICEDKPRLSWWKRAYNAIYVWACIRWV